MQQRSLYRGRKAACSIKTMILEKYHSVFELNEGEEWGGTWREYVILDDCLIMYYSFYSL